MRVSADHIERHGSRIWLDGVEQYGVYEADDVAGYVIREALDEDGNPIVDGDYSLVEKVFGVVKIKRADIFNQ